MKKILIVGAGAVGGYFGGLLCKSGIDVTFMVRPATYQRISQEGLVVKSVQGDFTVHPTLIQHASEAASTDLIILTVKCYDVAAALEEVAPLVKKGAVILTLQNGVDTEERILSYFQENCVVAGVAYITARLAEPGVIEHYRRGMISLGELSGEKSGRATEIHQILVKAGISCNLTSRIRQAKWEKLCWNATFNPLSVILDHPISLILDSPPLLDVVREGIFEVIRVAATEGIEIKETMIEETISVSGQFKEFHTSMYEDYTNRKPTEIEHLNGDLIRRGKIGGVPTPTHQALYALVKGLEMKRDTQGK
jgi:2-dehydropantoate 2-reductase